MTDNPELIRERDRRAAMFDGIMDDMGLDAIFLTSTAQQTCQLGIKYVSHYPLNTRRAFTFQRKGSLPVLIVPTVGQQFHAKYISWLPEENVLAGNIVATLLEQLATLPKDARVGWNEPGELPVSIAGELAKTGLVFVDITDEFRIRRSAKSPLEVRWTREAGELAIRSFEHILPMLRPGVTEREIIGAAEGFLRANGAQDSLVLCRSEKPHSFISRAKDVPIAPDGVFVYSAELAGTEGYWTQIIRPVFMARDAQPEAQEILKAIRVAEKAGTDQIIPGRTIADVDIAISRSVAESGYHTGVWSGHGMGADLGNGVDIGASNHMVIQPNMVLTLHPSIVSDTDGLLYSNTFLAREDGPCENTTNRYTGSQIWEDLMDEMKSR